MTFSLIISTVEKTRTSLTDSPWAWLVLLTIYFVGLTGLMLLIETLLKVAKKIRDEKK